MGRWELYTPPVQTFQAAPAFGRLPLEDPNNPSIWAGEKYTIEGEVVLTRRESGWTIQAVDIKRISSLEKSAPSSIQAQHAIRKKLQYDAAGGLNFISVEKRSGGRVEGTSQYRLQFRVVAE